MKKGIVKEENFCPSCNNSLQFLKILEQYWRATMFLFGCSGYDKLWKEIVVCESLEEGDQNGVKKIKWNEYPDQRFSEWQAVNK